MVFQLSIISINSTVNIVMITRLEDCHIFKKKDELY